LLPDKQDVVADRVKLVNPPSHVACPSKDFFPFDEGEGNGNPSYQGIKSDDSSVGSEISQQLFHKVRGFGPVSIEDSR
jgi:hypothetical protein